MRSLASNPNFIAAVTGALLFVALQFVRGKRRNDATRLILYGFGVTWLFVLFVETTGGHTRETLLPVVLAVCAFIGGILRWKMWTNWARNKYSNTRIVFEDPNAGADSGTVPPPPVAPAGWFADASSRHQLRYWDGSQWTEHVADNGKSTVDPVR